MKRVISVLLIALASLSLSAQNVSDKLLEAAKAGIKDAEEISLHTSPSILQVDQYLIPVAETTQAAIKKENGTYSVWFALQKGTAVTSTKDPHWRRASFQLTFISKRSARSFVKAFEHASKGN